MLYVSVRVLNVPYHVDKLYTYHLPAQLEKRAKVGSVAVVPFGGANKLKNAVITEILTKTDCKKTKPVAGIPGKYLFVQDELLKLCDYMKDTLYCSFGDAAKCVLPAGLGVKAATVYFALDVVSEAQKNAESSLNAAAKTVLEFIRSSEDGVSQRTLKQTFGKGSADCATALVKLCLCESQSGFECTVNEKNEKYASLCEDTSIIDSVSDGTIKLTPKQASVVETLMRYESPCPASELSEVSGAGISVINDLAKRNILTLFDVEKDRNALLLHAYDKSAYGDFTLNEKQQSVYETLNSLYRENDAKAALLYGVTGSGKTNVILKLIDDVIADGKSVIVLVPEIALTSQTVGRFAARYGNGVVLIHSALSAGERMDAWKKIHENKAKIVIGTRSAVFAPVKNLGLIVLDEEQEGSFKSERAPKYHARDVARFRCAYNKCLMVLASATPSLESYYKAKELGKYTLVTIDERFNGALLPEVEFYDMRREPYFEVTDEGDDNKKSSEPATLGQALRQEIAENLKNGEQTILFINRRGFRAFAQCHSCGHTFECPNCSVSLTHHKNPKHNNDFLMCHYCGYSSPLPEKCPVCSKTDSIVYMGAGTQLLEKQLKRIFPGVRVARMDADTTGAKCSHEKILEGFRNGDADILVGTQMVAKGHDFPNVSLVGIINADTSLYLNDYRANEKTFSLLTQVLGRAGRSGKRGRAVIQTYTPDNDILNLSGKQDYRTFYDREIAFRRAALFPPFCDIVTFNFSAPVENDLINAVSQFSKILDETAREQYGDVKFVLFGPVKNEIYRLGGKYRMRFIIKCKNNQRTRELFSYLYGKFSVGLKEVSISLDVNPQNL